MLVRTFKAKTASEALRSIKGELGPDAIILGSRTLSSGHVEVEASRGHLALVPREPQQVAPAEARRGRGRPVLRTAPMVAPPMPDLAADLEPVRALLRGFLKEADASRRHAVPPVAAPVFLALVEQGVSEALARALACDAAEGAADEATAEENARKLLAQRLPCGGELRLGDGERKVVAMIGPTGVGKTTVMCKLAALASLRDGVSVGLIAADVSRLGAIDQVRRFAEVLGAPFAVALSREGLRDALPQMGGARLVFVDTAGRSARDEAELTALTGLFERPPTKIERHLCLSANAKEKDNLLCVDRFRAVGYQRVLFTKLDETETFGGIYTAVRAARRPLSYVTRAPQIPEEIFAANPADLAELVLPRRNEGEVR